MSDDAEGNEPPTGIPPRPDRSWTLMLLRAIHRPTFKELAAAIGVPARKLGRFERGKEVLPWDVVFAVATALKVPLATVYELRYIAWAMTGARRREPGAAPRDPFDYSPEEQERRYAHHRDEQELRAAGLRWARRFLEVLGDLRLELPAPPVSPALAPEALERAEVGRRAAGEAWAGLREIPSWRLDDLPLGGETWALCERLCHESAALAVRLEGEENRHGPGRDAPEELAWLAVRVGCLAREAEEGTPRIREYAWAHLGNARRAAGSFAGAEEAFLHADEHYIRDGARPWGALDGARPFLLKAFLRRDQGRLEDALALLAKAEPLVRPADPDLHLLAAAIHLSRRALDETAAALEQALAAFARQGTPPAAAARQAVRLGLELTVLHTEEGRLGPAVGLWDQTAAWLEAAALPAGARTQLKLFNQLIRREQLTGGRARKMWEEYQALEIPRRPPRPGR
jgi:hypothetical protein